MTNLPFNTEPIPPLAFFSERGTRDLASFFAVAETVLGVWLLCERCNVALAELLIFFVDSKTTL